MPRSKRELMESIYVAIMQADARGFENSAAALRNVLDELKRPKMLDCNPVSLPATTVVGQRAVDRRSYAISLR